MLANDSCDFEVAGEAYTGLCGRTAGIKKSINEIRSRGQVAR
jgi:hypothetical protein